jgi:tetratricopeptide (TPR) repeat protein
MTPETFDIPRLRNELQAARADNDLARSSLLLGMLGRASLQSKRAPEAITAFEKAIPMARKVGDKSAEARHRANLGVAYSQIGNFNEASRNLRRAQNLAIQLSDQELICDILVQLAYLNTQREEYVDALDLLALALDITEGLQDSKRRMRIYGLIGEIQMLLGEIDTAEENYRAALKLARELNDLAEEGVYNISVVQALCERQEYKLAIPWIKQALAWAGGSDLERVPPLWAQLGEAYEQSGNLEEGRSAYRRCLELASANEWLALRSKVYGELSAVESELGNLAESVNCAKKAVSLAEVLGKAEPFGEAAVYLMFAYQEAGDFAKAREAGNQAIAVYHGLGKSQMVEMIRKSLNEMI